MRVLSGIQPTGRFHWGNYFGAIRQYVDLQHEDSAYYFIANLHALNAVRDPELLQQLTLDAAIDLLALGLNPEKAILFVQSDVPEVSQLCWLLMTGTPMGLLERCHAYKDKIAKGQSADAGLFTYPVLMAADILAYDSDTVPVGADQVQHIEVCRDIAGSFNHHFGQTFVMPKAKVLEQTAKVPGLDGEKMSKSYNNTLELFEDPKAQREKNHAYRDRFPANGATKGAGDRSFVSIVLAGRGTEPARRDGGAVPSRRLRLRRSEKSAGRRRREVFCGAESAPRRFGGTSGKSARDTGRWRGPSAKKAAEVLARVQVACGVRRKS